MINYSFKLALTLPNLSADGHLDSADDTIPNHMGSPRIEVQQSIAPRAVTPTSECGKISFYEK